MAAIAAPYISGNDLTLSVDGTELPVTNWEVNDNCPANKDAANAETGGEMAVTRGLKSKDVSFDVICKGALPAFEAGSIYAVNATLDGTVGYTGLKVYIESKRIRVQVGQTIVFACTGTTTYVPAE